MSSRQIAKLSKTHEAVQVLKLLQRTGFRTAIIAGGAIRDLFFQIQPKDYDIYLWNPYVSSEWSDGSEPKISEQYFRKLFDIDDDSDTLDSVWELKNDVDANGDAISEYDLNTHIDKVFNITKFGTAYQLIFVHTMPTRHVRHIFDLGICKGYCDGVKIRYLDDFMTDVRNKTITICDAGLTEEHFNYILNTHLPRVKRKFPNYTVVVHPANMLFVNNDNKHLLC